MDRNTVLAFALSMIVFVTYVMYQEDRRLDQAMEEQARIEAESTSGSAQVAGQSDDAAPTAEPSTDAPAAAPGVAIAERTAALPPVANG